MTKTTSMDEADLRAWLQLSLMPGMSARLFGRLLEAVASPRRALSCTERELRALGVKKRARQRILSWAGAAERDGLKSRVEQALEWATGENCHILTRRDQRYPQLLKEIPDPPPLLYAKGQLAHLKAPKFALVGSRNPSMGGRKNARLFAGEMARAGYTVVSGLAVGIDSESHKGALQAGCPTLAVLGTGIDQTYPASNKPLFAAIVQQGALLSEFPLGTQPLPAHFPQRNRIISGLSHGVLVVEAGIRSGSMATARHALEQGREVFAIPGSIHNSRARGCHQLIRDGAKLVQEAADILEELGALRKYEKQAAEEHKEKRQAALERLAAHSQDAEKVLAAIGYEATSIDEIITFTGLDIQSVNVTLMDLELEGLIQMEAGGYSLCPP